ncbi:MAG: hypothetical protein HUJ73_08015 [Eubacterium sp.]|nr:hypothetical protein [Eubacterium sp.]
MSILSVSLFALIAFEAFLIILCYILKGVPEWILLAIPAGVIAYADIALALYYRSNILNLVIAEIYIAMGILVFIDVLLTGPFRWSISYIIPPLFVTLMIVTVAIGKGMGLKPGDYIMKLFLHLILAFVIQLPPILIGVNTRTDPAFISMVFCVVFFLGIVIFNRRVFTGEVRKLFNN